MIGNDDLLDALKEALDKRGELIIPPAGYSMGSAWNRVEGVVMRPLQAGKKLSWGRVGVFRREGRWIIHRIIFPWIGRVLTKGDAVWSPDWPLVPQSEFQAEVVALQFKDGRRIDLTRPGSRLQGRLRSVAGWGEVALYVMKQAAIRLFSRRVKPL